MIVNLRELGGYRGHGGRRVKEGLLYRSGHLSYPTEILTELLSPLAISLVFDLRSADEVREEPYLLPEGMVYRHKPVVTSLEEGMQALNTAMAFSDKGNKTRYKASLSPELVQFLADFMPSFYREMGHNPGIFGDIIREILQNGTRPVLFHCSAGKDRTGILASLILLGLGVSPEEVRDHYLLSNAHRQEAIVRELAHIQSRIEDPLILDKVQDMLVVRGEYIDLVLDAVGAYPSFEAYAEDKMGLGEEDLASLRLRYLEA